MPCRLANAGLSDYKKKKKKNGGIYLKGPQEWRLLIAAHSLVLSS